MTPQALRERAKNFAVAIVRFSRTLPGGDEGRVFARQLLRAGTGVGANYRAVCRARSDPEFVAKLGTVIEETDETAFWLELLAETGVCRPAAVIPLRREADELLRIFVASRETARRRLRRPKSQIADHKSQIS